MKNHGTYSRSYWSQHHAPLERPTGGQLLLHAAMSDLIMVVLSELMAAMDESAAIVDVGCGRGELLERFRAMGWQARGVEPDPMLAEVAARHGEVTRCTAEECCRVLGRKSADIVTCIQVLKHTPNPSLVLSELLGLSRRYLLVCVPNLAALSSTLRACLGLRKALEAVHPLHLHGWDAATLIRFLDRTGAVVPVTIWGDVVRILPWRSRLRHLPVLGPLLARIEKALARRWPQCADHIALLAKAQ